MKDIPLTLRSLLRLLMSSMISLLVIGLFMLLLTRMDQGITIVIDMFGSWPNLLLTILVINFLALVLSHFPYYFDLALRSENKGIKWVKDYELGLFGFVYHNTDFDPKDHILIKILRRHLGIVMYSIWFLVLLNVKQKIFDDSIDIFLQFVVWNLIFILIHLCVQAYQTKIKSKIKEDNTAEWPVLKRSVRIFLVTYQFLFLLNLILIIYFLCKVNEIGWCLYNLNLLLLITFFNALIYILFRVSRSWFVYYNNSQGKQLDTEKYYPQRLGTDFTVFTLFPFRYLASTPNYLAAMGFFGGVFALPVLFVGLLTPFGLQGLNPIPLLVIVILFYYSAVVITLKHFVFHRSKVKESNDNTGNLWASRLLFLFPFFIVALFFSMATIDNDLHTLQLIEGQENEELNAYEMSKNEFVSHIDTSYDKHFIVGSYGGGLKANIWNLLLLNELTKENDNFLKSTLCLSGVSGGAIGISNFTAFNHNYNSRNYQLLNEKINKIGQANMLSTDLFGWLVKDFWREAIPGSWFSFYGKDRAHISMNIYSKMIHEKDVSLTIPMRTYWMETFKKHNYFPAVIFNTTPTTSNYGVGCSVSGLNFPIAIDILDFTDDNKDIYNSISFFGAASTTNRFPIFSPTARIPQKGHFVDGGYFENSGLLYAKHFYDEIIEDSLLEFDSIVAINIVNDKAQYIVEKLKDHNLESFSGAEMHEGEFLSILKGIVALERLPRYVRELIERDDNIGLVSLQMPYPFDVDDIKSLFLIEAIPAEYRAELQKIIDGNNTMIVDALKQHTFENGQIAYDLENWGIVVPPLGRLMSKPAVEYQRAMVKYHKDVRSTIDEILLE